MWQARCQAPGIRGKEDKHPLPWGVFSPQVEAKMKHPIPQMVIFCAEHHKVQGAVGTCKREPRPGLGIKEGFSEEVGFKLRYEEAVDVS